MDRVGIIWSALCALHCAAPLALAGVAIVTGTAGQHGQHAHGHAGNHVQLALAITSVVLVGVLLARSHLSKHRDWRPLGMFGLAVTMLGLGNFPWRTEATAMVMTTAGFAGLVAAQLVNLALTRRTSGCCAGHRCCC